MPSRLHLIAQPASPALARLTHLVRRPCRAAVLAGCVLLGACAHQASAPTAPAGTPLLYQQLGGVAGIQRVAFRTIDRVAHDPRTQRTFDGIHLSYLQQSVANYLCKVADGPCVYDGETMRNAHADLNIGGSEFDVMVQTLREELDAAGVSPAAKNELLRRLAPSRRDIVTH